MQFSDFVSVTLDSHSGTIGFYDEDAKRFLGFFDMPADRFYTPEEWINLQLPGAEHWEILDHFIPEAIGENVEQTVFFFEH